VSGNEVAYLAQCAINIVQTQTRSECLSVHRIGIGCYHDVFVFVCGKELRRLCPLAGAPEGLRK
jgi:hypothetical protein